MAGPRRRHGGVDLGAGKPNGGDQHAQVVAQALHGGGVGLQARLDAADRAQQHFVVGIAAAPGVLGEEGAAARALRQRRAKREKLVVVGRVRRSDRRPNGSFAMGNP